MENLNDEIPVLAGRRSLKIFIVACSVGSLLIAPYARADGGGGSAALFSLDRSSPSAVGFSPSDLFVDDFGLIAPGEPPPSLTVALAADALGLASTDNIVGVSSGRDNGIPVILANLSMNPNPLNQASVIYQFSVGRDAADDIGNGPVDIPFEAGVLVHRREDFPPQYPADQAPDIFDNRCLISPRWNWPMVYEEYLELLGDPAPVIDNIDAFTSVGSFAGYDADENLQLDSGKAIFAVFDSLSAGFDPATIYVNNGTNTPGGTGWAVYADPTQLGLQPGDRIDALSVWDVGTTSVFDEGDGIIFSLEEGSPTITPPFVFPDDPLMVSIDQGGIFLALPPPSGGIAFGLPSGYFSLDTGDELDEIYAIDPRLESVCDVPDGSVTRPMDAIALSPSYTEVLVGDAVGFLITLNDAMRDIPTPGGLISWGLVATVEGGGSIVHFTGALCQTPPGPPLGCQGCSTDPPIPPLPACNGQSDTTSGSDFGVVRARNVCLAQLIVQGTSPGITRVRITAATMNGENGPINVVNLHVPDDTTVTAYAEAIINVKLPDAVSQDGNASALMFDLSPNFPNPFNPTTRIEYTLRNESSVRLMIFDVLGQEIKTLLNGRQPAGIHIIQWDGTNRFGENVGGGVYFYRLDVLDDRGETLFVSSRKMVLIR
jgi:hypothetical protein